MFAVRRAVHIRTGQRAAAEALDGWLAQHAVEVVGLPDVYDGCVYLLRNYATVPDLVLIGVDWLAEDEFALVRYVRETWPRAGVVIYGSSAATPSFDWAAWTYTCRSDAALREMIAEPPAALLQRLAASAAPAPALPPAADVLPDEQALPLPPASAPGAHDQPAPDHAERSDGRLSAAAESSDAGELPVWRDAADEVEA